MGEKRELDRAVSIFSSKMRKVLKHKADSGWHGWNHMESKTVFPMRIMRHIFKALQGAKGHWVHIANYAMFMDHLENKQ